MNRRKRYGPVGSNYNSKRFLALHNRNISEGVQRHWLRQRAHRAVTEGNATAEQLALVGRENKFVFAFCALWLLLLWALVLTGRL